MEMIFQGMSMSLFQAKQQWSKMSSQDLKTRFESQLSRMNCQMFSTGFELGRFRRQRQERDVVWDGKLLRDMPSRLIKKKDGVRAGRDCDRDFLQMQGHSLAVAGG